MNDGIEVQDKRVGSDEVENDEGVLEGLSAGAAQWMNRDAEEYIARDRVRYRFGAGHDCIELAVLLPGEDPGVQEMIWRRPLVLPRDGLVAFVNTLNRTANLMLGED